MLPDVGGEHAAEHHDHEHERGHVEEQDQRAEAGQRGQAELADRVGHRAERTQRGGLHDEAQHLEHDLGEPLDPGHHGFPDAADGLDRDTEDHRQEDDL
jgi:hypothetical protein